MVQLPMQIPRLKGKLRQQGAAGSETAGGQEKQSVQLKTKC